MPLAFPPLPVARVSYGRPGYQDFAFTLADAQGMQPRPPGYHGAVDWFAEPNEPVRAARAGVVVESSPSRGNTGQVFGGTVKVQERGSMVVWVYRHVDPRVRVGQRVEAGDVIANVTAWTDGPDHAHIEIWRSLAGGYNFHNALDPRTYTFTVVYRGTGKPPPPDGKTLRLVLNGRQWAGWEEAGGPLQWIARKGIDPKAKTAIAWQGRVWRTPAEVTNVARNLTRRFL